jgi:Fe-S-cluster containining protein
MSSITECQRCGTCCCKGGPALHLEDQTLVESGSIALSDLFTIRQGEPALDNITNTIAPAVTDIILIKGLPDNRPHCRHYDYAGKACRIYDSRPLECRTLECWDTEGIERIYNLRRLTRRHLLSKVEGLWALVQEHQERCDYGCVAELADNLKRPSTDDRPVQELLSIIQYDENLRHATEERSGIDPEILTFLFGRPLSFTIQLFRLKLKQTPQGKVIESMGPTHEQVCYRRQ